MLTEVCSHCHNTVAGQFSPSNTRKWLTAIAKKGGMKAVLAAVGSAVPVIGNIGGFLTGTAIDMLYGKDIDKFIDKIADQLDDNKVYIFECPQCGHSWTRKEDEIGLYESEEDEVGSLEDALREKEAEIEGYFERAKEYGLLSNQFRHYANLGFETARSLLEELDEIADEVVDDDEMLSEIVESMSYIEYDLVEQFFRYIVDNCKGTMDSPIPYVQENTRKPISMEVYGAYRLFAHESIMLVGVIHTGTIKIGQNVQISDDISVKVERIEMFGKSIGEAEAGDVCAIIIPKSYVDEDGEEYDLEFPDNVFMISAASDSKGSGKTDLTEKEEEYISEYKSFIEEDPVISDRERRLLNRISKSLGITEARAKELEALCEKIELTAEEQEYADEIKACLEGDGVISDRERRLLNRLRLSLEISEDRAREIEDSLK
ncbi:MAG: hypothetical protein K2G11_09275 [Muribaculaceae bacterium]|nr:hypothetical protein [Muribaculaceae bacterium]